MIAEGISKLMELVNLANKKPDFVTMEREPGHVYFHRWADGTLIRKNAEPPPRAYTVNRLKDFTAAMKWMPHDQRAVFIGKSEIEGILREHVADPLPPAANGAPASATTAQADRRERVTMGLELSDAYATLCAMNSSEKPLDHEDFIEVLRIRMNGCLPAETLALLRHLKFEHAAKGDSEINFARQSINRSVLNEMVAGSGKSVPETLSFNTAVFKTPITSQPRWVIQMALVVDLFKGTFRLRELNGWLDAAMVMTQEWIAEQIAQDLPEALVVCGEVG